MRLRAAPPPSHRRVLFRLSRSQGLGAPESGRILRDTVALLLRTDCLVMSALAASLFFRRSTSLRCPATTSPSRCRRRSRAVSASGVRIRDVVRQPWGLHRAKIVSRIMVSQPTSLRRQSEAPDTTPPSAVKPDAASPTASGYARTVRTWSTRTDWAIPKIFSGNGSASP